MITAKDVDCIYEVPLVFHEEGLDERIVEKLNIWTGAPQPRRAGRRSSQTVKNPKERVKIAIVGKYVDLDRLVQEPERGAERTAASPTTAASSIDYVDSEQIEQEGTATRSADADGILVPMGFGAARHRGQDRGGPLRAREARCRSSASASACRWR